MALLSAGESEGDREREMWSDKRERGRVLRASELSCICSFILGLVPSDLFSWKGKLYKVV